MYSTSLLHYAQLKRKDGSVDGPPIEETRLADQSRKHPFAQLTSLRLNIYFNEIQPTPVPRSLPSFLSGSRALLDSPRSMETAAAARELPPRHEHCARFVRAIKKLVLVAFAYICMFCIYAADNQNKSNHKSSITNLIDCNKY